MFVSLRKKLLVSNVANGFKGLSSLVNAASAVVRLVDSASNDFVKAVSASDRDLVSESCEAVNVVSLVSNVAILFSSIFTLVSRVAVADANFESTACAASVAAASVSVRSVSNADVSESFSSFVDLAMFAAKSSLSTVRAESPASNRSAISWTVIENGGLFWSLVCSSSMSAISDFERSKSPSAFAFISSFRFTLITCLYIYIYLQTSGTQCKLVVAMRKFGKQHDADREIKNKDRNFASLYTTHWISRATVDGSENVTPCREWHHQY